VRLEDERQECKLTRRITSPPSLKATSLPTDYAAKQSVARRSTALGRARAIVLDRYMMEMAGMGCITEAMTACKEMKAADWAMLVPSPMRNARLMVTNC
jgi:hypothetical protein